MVRLVEQQELLVNELTHSLGQPLQVLRSAINQLVKAALTRLSLFSQAKFFLKIVICNNINQLWNFSSFAKKHNLLIIQ